MKQKRENLDNTPARTYGALATNLNESLSAARDALERHAGLLPQGRLAELDRLLAEFARRRVRIAIYGEVKAGKSTLLNAIAGAELSPSAFDPLTSIPVRVTYGQETKWRVNGRTFDNAAELAKLMRNGVVDAREVVVQTNLDLLQLGGQVDLEDTPGVGAETRFDTISAKELASLDAVVLVVRYPGLFTRYTRQLVRQLENDIGKLFVVWNVDGACADLGAEERERQAEALRNNVAGAHELYLVNAKAALDASRQNDARALDTSGLPALTAGLGRFASSDKREVTALREAAKRAHGWLQEAQQALSARQSVLESTLAAARSRLQSAETEAEHEVAAARAKFISFQKSVEQLGTRHGAEAAKLAGKLRKSLRAARRRWIRTADVAALEQAIAAAAEEYTQAVDTACKTTIEGLRDASRQIDTVIPIAPREQSRLDIGDLAPAERRERATSGSWPTLRRALWRRWYLPGLTTLERAGIKEELGKQASWFEATAHAAGNAARAALDATLAEINRHAMAEAEHIKEETELAANEAELEEVNRHLPVVSEQCGALARVNQEARALLG